MAIGVGLFMGAAAIGFIVPIRWLEAQPEKRADGSEPTAMLLTLGMPIVGALLTGLVFTLLPLSLIHI